MQTHDIQTAEPLKSLFPIADQTLGAITADMMQSGYDSAFPIITWAGRNIVVDGHTRLAAAMAASIEDVPAVERAFTDEDAAVRYAIECQRNRRNLTDADIIRLVRELDKRRRQGERTDLASGDAKSGKSASETAKAIGISTSKVERARRVIDKAAPEVKMAVEAGGLSINAAVKDVATKKKPGAKQEKLRPIGPPCDGMQFAHMAIMDLNQIETDDAERTEALQKVKDFLRVTASKEIEDHIRQSPKHCMEIAWKAAKKSERESFLQWVDKERSKDLPKVDYRTTITLARRLRRALRNADAGIVNMVKVELDLGGE